MNIEECLLITSPGDPGDGGLLYYCQGRFIRLSELSATGLFVDKQQLVCGLQGDGGSHLLMATPSRSSVVALSDSPVDIHDVLVENGELYIVATESNEVLHLDDRMEIKERWGLAGEHDSAHLNSIAFYQGRLIASLFGRFDQHRGYKGATKNAGQVIDIRTGETLIEGLSQPHSLTVVNENTLLLCSSEDMELHEYQGWNLVRKLKLPAYCRGIYATKGMLYVGLSQSRNVSEDQYALTGGALALVEQASMRLLETVPVPLREIYDICPVSEPLLVVQALMAEKAHDLDLQISRLNEEVAQQVVIKDAQHVTELAALRQQSADKVTELSAGYNKALKKYDKALKKYDKALKKSGKALKKVQAESEAWHAELMRTYQSISWKLTKPVRWGRYVLDGRMFKDHFGHWFSTEHKVEHKVEHKPADISEPPEAPELSDDPLVQWGVQEEQAEKLPLPLKPIAIYFPQLHSIPENDEWWGKGFTDWDNVKKARPQYDGHDQPRVPQGGNYYDQSKLDVIRKQIELAGQYGIYGFCHYHYWFDGKQLLETPTQLFLENKDLNMPFCLSWANETWSRRWDGLDREILIQQNHPVDKQRWKLHFDYLIQCWTDERAIKVDGKPVFCIYNPNRIPEVEQMLDYWRNLAVQHGLDGLYFIHQKSHDYEDGECLKGFDAEFLFEPNEAANSPEFHRDEHGRFTHLGRYVYYRLLPEAVKGVLKGLHIRYQQKLNIRDYDKVWKIAISKRSSHLPVTFPGAFPDWDNTPRYKERAIIYKGASPERFEYWLRKLAATMPARKLPENFIFINAWNEWAEGAYLEPDESHGLAYLEAVKKVIGHE